MALKLYTQYPGRFDPVSTDYPQGKWRNRSSSTANDGGYLEEAHMNDIYGFFGALLRNAEIVPDGTVDTARKSQFYDALITIAKSVVPDNPVDIAQELGNSQVKVMSQNAVTEAIDDVKNTASDIANKAIDERKPELNQIADRALTYAERAESASSSASLSAGLYSTVEDGMAQTVSGDLFNVLSSSDDNFIDLYRNEDPDAVFLKSYPSSDYVSSADKKIRKDISQQFLPVTNTEIDGVLVSITDELNNRTWLEANKEDGGPTDFSFNMLESKIGVNFRSVENNGELVFAITDKSGVVSDLCFNENGQFPDFVVESLQERMVFPENKEDYRQTEYNPFLKKSYDVGVYGSSTLQVLHPFLTADFAPLTVYEKAKGGATIDSVLFRMGLNSAIKFKEKFTDEKQEVETEFNYNNDKFFIETNLADDTGNLYEIYLKNDVPYTKLLNNQTADYGYLPNYENEFFPVFTDGLSSDFIIFNAGKNNINMTTNMAIVDTLFNKHVELSKFLTQNNTRFLFLGNFSNTNYVDARIAIVEALNVKLRDKFRNFFLDVNEIVLDPKTWTELGLTQTQEDIDALAKRVLPPSFSRGDAGHFNSAFNTYLSKIIKKRYDSLKARG